MPFPFPLRSGSRSDLVPSHIDQVNLRCKHTHRPDGEDCIYARREQSIALIIARSRVLHVFTARTPHPTRQQDQGARCEVCSPAARATLRATLHATRRAGLGHCLTPGELEIQRGKANTAERGHRDDRPPQRLSLIEPACTHIMRQTASLRVTRYILVWLGQDVQKALNGPKLGVQDGASRGSKAVPGLGDGASGLRCPHHRQTLREGWKAQTQFPLLSTAKTTLEAETEVDAGHCQSIIGSFSYAAAVARPDNM